MQLVSQILWKPEPEGKLNVLKAVLVVTQVVEAGRPVAVSQAQLRPELWGADDTLCVQLQSALVLMTPELQMKKILCF